MKPFVFLGTRAEDAAADDEYAAILRCTGLDESDVRRLRVERSGPHGADGLADLDLDAVSGIVLGGGPFNASDPDEAKSPAQRRAEAALRDLALRVLDADFPFLGACYGVGVLGGLRGGLVDRTHGEPVGNRPITLTEAGRQDPLFADLPSVFDAFLGHKEAVTRLPEGAVLLATSPPCPVQAFRIGEHVYATQFHPELDVAGLCLRIDVYRHHGYFEPAEADALQAMARASDAEHPPRLLSGFVARYAR